MGDVVFSISNFIEPFIVALREEGTYVQKTETDLGVSNGLVVLTELPYKNDGVSITDGATAFTEILDPTVQLGEFEFRVNYNLGYVYLNTEFYPDGVSIDTIEYTGRGLILAPADRIYGTVDGNTITLQDLIDALVASGAYTGEFSDAIFTLFNEADNSKTVKFSLEDLSSSEQLSLIIRQRSSKMLTDTSINIDRLNIISGVVNIDVDLAINASPTGLDISEFTAFFVQTDGDGNSFEGETLIAAQTVAVPSISGYLYQYIFSDINGNITFETFAPTGYDKTKVMLGYFLNNNGTAVDGFINTKTEVSITTNLERVSLAKNLLVMGMDISNNGANLKLDHDDGVGVLEGLEPLVDDSPSDRDVLSALGFDFYRVIPTAENEVSELTLYSDVDPNNYWDGAALISVPAGKFTIQRIEYRADDNYSVVYGEELFDTLADAEASLLSAQSTKTLIPYSTSFAKLVVEQGTTDLSNTAKAKIYNFDDGFGGSSGTITIPDDSITNNKLGTDVKVGSNALYQSLTGTSAADVYAAMYELFEDINTPVIDEKVPYNGSIGTFDTSADGASVAIAGANLLELVNYEFQTLEWMVSNPDFRDGTNDWIATAATLSVVDNVAIVSGTSGFSRIYQNDTLTVDELHYFYAEIEYTEDIAGATDYPRIVTLNESLVSYSGDPVAGEKIILEGIATPTESTFRLNLYGSDGFDVYVYDAYAVKMPDGVTTLAQAKALLDGKIRDIGIHWSGESENVYPLLDNRDEFSAWTLGGNIVASGDVIDYIASTTTAISSVPINWSGDTEYTVLSWVYDNNLTDGINMGDSGNNFSNTLVYSAGENGVKKTLITTQTTPSIDTFRLFSTFSGSSTGSAQVRFTLLKGDYTHLTDAEALRVIQGEYLKGVQVEQILSNPEFNDGDANWLISSATGSVVNGIYSFTANAIFGSVRQNYTFTTGISYYVVAMVKADSSSVVLAIQSSGTTTIPHSGSGEYEKLSGIKTPSTDGTDIRVTDLRASAWTEVEVDYVTAYPIPDSLKDAPIAFLDTYFDKVYEGVETLYLPILEIEGIFIPTVGKNQLDVGKNSITENGVTVEYIGNGQLKISGTPSTNTRINIVDELLFGSNSAAIIALDKEISVLKTDYQLSVNKISGSFSGSTSSVTWIDEFVTTSKQISLNGDSDTIDQETYDFGAIYLLLIGGEVFSDLIINVQFELGTSPTDYEDYRSTVLHITKGGHGIGGVFDDLDTQRFGVDYNDVVQNATGWIVDNDLGDTSRFRVDLTSILDAKEPIDVDSLSNTALQIGDVIYPVVTGTEINSIDSEGQSIRYTGSGFEGYLVIRVLESRLSTVDSAGMEAYLQENNVLFIYELDTYLDRNPENNNEIPVVGGLWVTQGGTYEQYGNGVIGEFTVDIPVNVYAQLVLNIIMDLKQQKDINALIAEVDLLKVQMDEAQNDIYNSEQDILVLEDNVAGIYLDLTDIENNLEAIRKVVTLTYVSAGLYSGTITGYTFEDQDKLTLKFIGDVPSDDLDLPATISVDGGTTTYPLKLKDTLNAIKVRALTDDPSAIADVIRDGSDVIINREMAVSENLDISAVSDSTFEVTNPINGMSLILEILAISPEQSVENGDATTSVISDDSNTSIALFDTGLWALSATGYNAGQTTFPITSGNKYLLVVKLLPTSVGRIENLFLKYDDESLQDVGVVADQLFMSGIITANYTGLANFRVQEGTTGQVDRDYQMLIPLTNKTYASLTASELDAKFPSYIAEGINDEDFFDLDTTGVQLADVNNSYATRQDSYENNAGAVPISVNGDTIDFTINVDFDALGIKHRAVAGKTYTFSYESVTNANRIRGNYLDENFNYLSVTNITNGQSILAPNGTAYVELQFIRTSGTPLDCQVVKPVINEGTTAKDYVKYNTANIKVPVGISVGTVQDRTYFDNDVWKLERKNKLHTLTEDDITVLSTSGTNIDRVQFNKANVIPEYKYTTQAIAGALELFGYPDKSYVDSTDNEYTHAYNFSAANATFLVPKGTYASLAEAKTDFAGKVVRYQLADEYVTTETVVVYGDSISENVTTMIQNTDWGLDYTINFSLNEEAQGRTDRSNIRSNKEETDLLKQEVETLDAENVKKDGSVAMEGDFDMGGFNIINVAAGVPGIALLYTKSDGETFDYSGFSAYDKILYKVKALNTSSTVALGTNTYYAFSASMEYDNDALVFEEYSGGIPGFCSDLQYTDEPSCTLNGEVWTPSTEYNNKRQQGVSVPITTNQSNATADNPATIANCKIYPTSSTIAIVQLPTISNTSLVVEIYGITLG